jgi:hypothetical protein
VIYFALSLKNKYRSPTSFPFAKLQEDDRQKLPEGDANWKEEYKEAYKEAYNEADPHLFPFIYLSLV